MINLDFSDETREFHNYIEFGEINIRGYNYTPSPSEGLKELIETWEPIIYNNGLTNQTLFYGCKFWWSDNSFNSAEFERSKIRTLNKCTLTTELTENKFFGAIATTKAEVEIPYLQLKDISRFWQYIAVPGASYFRVIAAMQNGDSVSEYVMGYFDIADITIDDEVIHITGKDRFGVSPLYDTTRPEYVESYEKLHSILSQDSLSIDYPLKELTRSLYVRVVGEARGINGISNDSSDGPTGMIAARDENLRLYALHSNDRTQMYNDKYSFRDMIEILAASQGKIAVFKNGVLKFKDLEFDTNTYGSNLIKDDWFINYKVDGSYKIEGVYTVNDNNEADYSTPATPDGHTAKTGDAWPAAFGDLPNMYRLHDNINGGIAELFDGITPAEFATGTIEFNGCPGIEIGEMINITDDEGTVLEKNGIPLRFIITRIETDLTGGFWQTLTATAPALSTPNVGASEKRSFYNDVNTKPTVQQTDMMITDKVGDINNFWGNAFLNPKLKSIIEMLNWSDNWADTTFVKKPETVYDASPGILATQTKESDFNESNYQITGLDLTPYTHIKCFIKSGGDITVRKTPPLVIDISLDAGMKTDLNHYLGQAVGYNQSDTDVWFRAMAIVSGDKTKLAFLDESSLLGTAEGARNNYNRYLYLIKGYYD